MTYTTNDVGNGSYEVLDAADRRFVCQYVKNGKEVTNAIVRTLNAELRDGHLVPVRDEVKEGLVAALEYAHQMIQTHGLREVSMHSLSDGGRCLDYMRAALNVAKISDAA